MSAALHMDEADRTQLLTRWLATIKGVPGHVIESTAAEGFKGSPLPLDDVPAAAARLLRDSNRSDTYLRTTTTRQPIDSGRGTKADTYGVFGLWGDLDHNEGVHKPPSNGLVLPDDITACLKIIETLPEPTLIINSSGGLQPWWLLSEAVTVDERPDLLDIVEAWGEMLVTLGKLQGVHVDKVGDPTRVLRPPGTLNHKWKQRAQDPRVVTVHSSTGIRYTLDELARYIPDDGNVVDLSTKRTSASGDHSDIERWEAETDWKDILEPAGWTLHHTYSDGCREWTRPGDGHSSKRSAVTDFAGKPTMVVHTSATALPSGGGQRLTKFRVYAALQHNDDLRKASDEIRAKHGVNTTPNLVPAPGDSADKKKEKSPEPDRDVRVVEPPTNPHPNAAAYVADRHTEDGHTLLAHHGGQWNRWDGQRWGSREPAALVTDLYNYFGSASYQAVDKDGNERLKPFQPTKSKIADLVHAMQAVCYLPSDVAAPAWLDGRSSPPAREIIACRNGLLHWPSRTLHNHTPAYFTHHAVPFDFDADATSPTAWLAFLDTVWGDDPESIECLQEMFGYLLSGDTSQQKIFSLIGPKRSGKGTIARVLTSLVGAHNVAGPTMSGLGQNFGLQDLIDKPIAVIADARLRYSQDTITERLLSISGEDLMTVDRKFRDPWTGKLGTRFVLLSNDLPNLADASGALASRFVMLTTTESFYGREDHDLTGRLHRELPAILNWSLDGLERLRARGRFINPASSRDALQEMEDLGSPVAAFVRDRCVLDGEVETSQLYRAWLAWCEENGREHPGTQQRFGRDLRSVVTGLRNVQRRDISGRRVRFYEGVRVDTGGVVPL